MQLQIERAQQIMQIISIGKNHEKLTFWHYSDIWKIWWNISWFPFNCLWNIMEMELSWIRLRSHTVYMAFSEYSQTCLIQHMYNPLPCVIRRCFPISMCFTLCNPTTCLFRHKMSLPVYVEEVIFYCTYQSIEAFE